MSSKYKYLYLLLCLSTASSLQAGDEHESAEKVDKNHPNQLSTLHEIYFQHAPRPGMSAITSETFATVEQENYHKLKFKIENVEPKIKITPIIQSFEWVHPTPAAGGGGWPPRIDYEKFWRKEEKARKREEILRLLEEHENERKRTLFDAFLLHQEQRRDYYNISNLISIPEFNIARYLNGLSINDYIHTNHPTHNTENVENKERRDKTKIAIEVVYATTKQAQIDEDQLVTSVISYIETIKNDKDQYNQFVRIIKSTGYKMNEVDNALRTISAPSVPPKDFSCILAGDTYIYFDDGTPMSVKGLLARTWWIIMNKHTTKEQGLLQYSLIKALGQCIEDDDHRVCGNGKSQRLVTVLQGYLAGIEIDKSQELPPVKSFIKVICDQKEQAVKALFNAPDAERLAFAKSMYKEVMDNARKVYGSSISHLSEVENLVKSYAENVLLVSDDIDRG